ncbi:hypothetical protein BX600DRAFT_509686 [Xylariales sp. PMI_506]|nr:hypothetical protein BX600DRAFT_509686 [Xylariales sp. PMI_506]
MSLAPAQDARKLQWLKQLSLTALYFEKPINDLMPEHRRHTHCFPARSNLQGRRIQALVGETGSLRAVWEALQHEDVDSQVEIAKILCPGTSLTCDIFKNYAFNFTGVNCTTVEFRQPPGPQSLVELRDWVRLATWFGMASLYLTADQINMMIESTTPASEGELEEFLKSALESHDEPIAEYWKGEFEASWDRLITYRFQPYPDSPATSPESSGEKGEKFPDVINMSD